jgi:hypothetical protein
MTVFVTIGETVGVKDHGLAPAIVSMATAYGITFVVFRDHRLAPTPLTSTLRRK